VIWICVSPNFSIVSQIVFSKVIHLFLFSATALILEVQVENVYLPFLKGIRFIQKSAIKQRWRQIMSGSLLINLKF
jgi:hypothetical protein